MHELDWAIAESQLKTPFGYARFRIDGYQITVRRQLDSKDHLDFVVYVNGEIQGKWFLNSEYEHLMKFYRRSERPLFTKKTIESLLKGYTKKELQDKIERLGLDKTITRYFPSFGRFAALKKSFIANNQSIELLETSDYSYQNPR